MEGQCFIRSVVPWGCTEQQSLSNMPHTLPSQIASQLKGGGRGERGYCSIVAFPDPPASCWWTEGEKQWDQLWGGGTGKLLGAPPFTPLLADRWTKVAVEHHITPGSSYLSSPKLCPHTGCQDMKVFTPQVKIHFNIQNFPSMDLAVVNWALRLIFSGSGFKSHFSIVICWDNWAHPNLSRRVAVKLFIYILPSPQTGSGQMARLIQLHRLH